MVSEDYLGLNDQLVLAVSHSKLLKSHLSLKEFIQLVAFETFGYIFFFFCVPKAMLRRPVLFSPGNLLSVEGMGIYNCGIPNHGILAPK